MELLNNEIDRLNMFYQAKERDFQNVLEELETEGHALVCSMLHIYH